MKSSLEINNSFLRLLLFFGLLWLCSSAQEHEESFVIVLDAGHGGKDPGKISGGIKEKDLALKFVLSVGELLEKQKGIKVVYTRKKDVFIDLFVRGKIANDVNADLFVSIHCNAFKNSKINGVETFVLGLHANRQNFEVAKSENEVIYLEDNYLENYQAYDINSPESIIGLTISQEEFLIQSVELASFVQENMSDRPNRGVKQAGFIVLHQTFMPSVLVETGFITNSRERHYLNSAKGQKDISKNISDAIIKYKSIHGIKNQPESVYDGDSEITFRVQIAVSHREIDLKPYNFKGLKDVCMEPYDRDSFRYTYGKTDNYKEAVKLKRFAVKKGYRDCYIIAFKNGEKIPLREVIR